jgi:hypothetical protein
VQRGSEAKLLELLRIPAQAGGDRFCVRGHPRRVCFQLRIALAVANVSNVVTTVRVHGAASNPFP